MAQNKTSLEHMATQMAELALEHSDQNNTGVSYGTDVTANNQALSAGNTLAASAGTAPASRIHGRSAILPDGKKRNEIAQICRRRRKKLRKMAEKLLGELDEQHDIDPKLRQASANLRETLSIMNDWAESQQALEEEQLVLLEDQRVLLEEQRVLLEEQRVLQEEQRVLQEEQRVLQEEQRVLHERKRIDNENLRILSERDGRVLD
ncbi:hypothetical protein PG984_006125 [Apiospora sp. TS-2023a]